MSGYLLLAGIFIIDFALSVYAYSLREFSRFRLSELVDDLKKEQKDRNRYHEKKKDRLLAFFENTEKRYKPLLLMSYIADIGFLIMLLYVRNIDIAHLGQLAILLLVYLFSVYLFCRLLAFNLAEEHAENIIYRNFPVIKIFSILLMPLGIVTGLLDNITSKAVRIGSEENDPGDDVEDDIKESITEGVEDGVLEEEEKRMIESVLKLDELAVREIMTPRTDVISIEGDTDIGHAITTAIESGYSRIPVYDEDVDTITGILYVKDLLPFAVGEGAGGKCARDLVREAYFVPESKQVAELFSEIRTNKNHFAVVLDEYGGTAGIVTAEDIIEEIVGEIEDEYDEETEEKIVWKSETVAEVDARIDIGELNELLEINLPDDDDFESLGGFLASETGKIPQQGDIIKHENARFRILHATERKILQVEITRESENTDEDADK